MLASTVLVQEFPLTDLNTDFGYCYSDNNIYFCLMTNKYLCFKRCLKLKVEQKYKCPIHGKYAKISATRMEFKITDCCCPDFKEFLSSVCEKYRVDILLGKYSSAPKKHLLPPHRNHR